MKNPLASALWLFLLTPAWSQTGEEVSPPTVTGLDTSLSIWRQEHGESWTLRVDRATGYVEMLYGGRALSSLQPDLSNENQWLDLARHWIASTVSMHGIENGELSNGRFTFLPLGMANGTDKVTVAFDQFVAGLPVQGGRVNVLMDTSGNLLSVHSTGAPLTEGLGAVPGISPRAAQAVARDQFELTERVPAKSVGLPLMRIAQVDETGTRRARLAYSVTVTNSNEPLGFEYAIDAFTGAVLQSSSTVHYFDVTGTLMSMATPGTEADHSGNPPVQIPMAYVDVKSSAGTVQTDRFGNFNFAGVNTPLDLTVQYDGTFNNVNNMAGGDYTITFGGVMPGQANTLVMNPSPTQYVTAQANAYHHINVVRDYIRDTVPSDNTADFKATSKPNINSSCNAYFDGSSVNYYRKAGSCNNTAFSSVIAHEYGHWLNVRYGTGNGSDGMGEGNADVFGMYPNDDPIVGAYFFTNGGFVRTGLNTRQYCGDGNGGCYGEVHADGEVWMGAAWKVRRNLKTTLGDALGSATADGLFVNWLNAYNQTKIDSIIEAQWLTLDDDDGNLGNGTPNFNDIDSAFLEQGFPGYDLDVVQFTNVTDLADVPADVGPYDVNADVVALINPPVTAVDLHYQVNGGGYTTVPMASTGGAGFAGQIPALGGNGIVSYYLSGYDNVGKSDDYPSAGSGAPLEFVVGVEQSIGYWDFEAGTDEGWTGGLPADTATSGQWERDDPVGTAAQPEFDVTADPGVNCWFTGQHTGGGVGSNDVDGGVTTLLSPVFDMTGMGGVKVSYWRWYSNDQGGAPNSDIFKIGISNDGGATWTNGETVGPAGIETSGGWYAGGFIVDPILPMTSQMQIRFRAADLSTGSIIEAAVDEVKITFLDAGCPAPSNYCTGAINSTGFGGTMVMNGSQSVSDNSFNLLAISLPANTPGIFIYGNNRNSLPVGDGFLCVGGSITRTAPVLSDFLGQLTTSLDFTNLPSGGPIVSGDTMFFQAWYRDIPAGNSGFNFTDGLQVQFCD